MANCAKKLISCTQMGTQLVCRNPDKAVQQSSKREGPST